MGLIEEIKAYLGEEWIKVNDLIRSSLKSDISILDSTNLFILSHTGKQVRPVISLLVSRMCSREPVLPLYSLHCAAVSELLHNATLLHDDVADDSSKRRGVPTVQSVLGGRSSVLIGDFWLVKAMDNILYDNDNCNRVMKSFARTLSDLAEGEMLQLEKAEKCDTTEEDYNRIIFSKTASLFGATAEAAAVSVNAEEWMVSAVRDFAVNIGMAFQIKDDILDYVGDDHIGKPKGKDLQEQKITLPLLGALGNVGPERAMEICDDIHTIHDHPEKVSDIQAFVLSNKGIEYAEDRLGSYVAKAMDALGRFPESKEKDYLCALAGFMADRQS